MTTTSTVAGIAQLAALPIVSAGILGGAALGLAAIASAQTAADPGYSYPPETHTAPAPTQAPGWQAHHGPSHVANLHHR